MFNNRDWFGLFSTFRFHQFFKPDFLPSQRRHALSAVVSQPDDTARQASSEPAKTDTIEKLQARPDSNTTAVDNTKHPSRIASFRPYSAAEILKRALNQKAEPDQDTNQPVEDQQLIQQTKWQNQVNMNLNFNLKEFEHSITRLVEDAGDGEVRTDTLNKISLGLHIDLSAKGTFEQITNSSGKDQEGGNPGQALVAKVRSASRQAVAMRERSRNYKAQMFYRESQRTSFKLKQEYSDGFLRISRKLSMRYTQDFSFNFRSLQSYNTQAEQLAQSGDLEAYLNNTEAMADNSQVTGDTIGRFFDIVQGYLDQAEGKLTDKINEYFDQLSSQLGIDAASLDQSREQTLATARAFFDKVENAFDSVKAKYISAQPELPVIDQPPPVEPDTNTAPADESEPADQPADEPEQIQQPAEEEPATA